MDCEKCEYWNVDEEVCGAFECNGIECPNLPCEEWWYFTFGWGQKHQGKYVKIRGTFNQARQKMIDKYGVEWGFQYPEKGWFGEINHPDRFWPVETELEVIE